MNNLKELSNYCIGTAESEEGLGCVDKIFVEPRAMDDIMSMCPGSPKLLVGNKGNGKTLIMTELRNRLERQGLEVLYATPSDIIGGDTPNGEEPAVLRDFYFRALVCGVASRLGAKLRGFVSGLDAILARQSLANGERSPDIVEKCLDGLSKFTSILVSKKDIVEISKGLHDKPSARSLENAVKDHMCGTSAPFYVFLDEPDDVGTENSAASRLWGLLNACREFSKKVKNLRCIVSLRTEMWHLLAHSESGRKNIDHFAPLVTFINPAEKDIENIVEKRLRFVAQRLGVCNPIDAQDFYSMFFEGRQVELPPPARDEPRSWQDYILKSSRARPRDAIQLIKTLADNAYLKNRKLIGSIDVRECSSRFSKTRLELLESEYAKDFPSAKHVYESFAGHNFSIPTENLHQILEQLIASGHIVVHGKALTRSGGDGVFELWNMLFQTGFINPCVPDARKMKNYRHVFYEENDTLVSPGNYKNMCKYTWEIHPAYRAYLYTLRDDEINRMTIVGEVKKFSKNRNFIGNVKKRRH